MTLPGRLAALVAGCVVLLAGCSRSATPTANLPHRPDPDLHAFLALPRAEPGHCAATENGTTVGRASPWVGTVDVSVFLKPSITTRQVLAVGNALRADPLVSHVYFESRHEAYQEFQRLYTCWSRVSTSQTPPSYRLQLNPATTIASRNELVARLDARPAVDSVSCDPAVPCTNVVASETPSPVGSRSARR